MQEVRGGMKEGSVLSGGEGLHLDTVLCCIQIRF